MKYNLFLDDERFPPDDGRDWVIARSFAQATEVVHKFGFPIYVSFDHDLGDDSLSGKAFANWLVEQDMEKGTMPDDFGFFVHSQNPVGAENIRRLLTSYLNWRKNEKT